MKNKKATAGIPTLNAAERNCTGFTLIEVIITMTLMAMVTIAAFPMVNRAMDSMRMDSTARELALVLQQSRYRAVRTQTEQFLMLDLDKKSYSHGRAPTEVVLETALKIPGNTEITFYTAEENIVGRQQASIHFFRDGSSSGGRILIKGPTREFHITTDWLTGRTRLEQKTPAP